MPFLTITQVLVCIRSMLPALKDNEESFYLITEESPSFHTEEMVCNSLSIINQNEGYSIGAGSCLNKACLSFMVQKCSCTKERIAQTLGEFVKSVCRANDWPSLDNRTMRRKLAIKICNARRGLKKSVNLETNNGVAGFC